MPGQQGRAGHVSKAIPLRGRPERKMAVPFPGRSSRTPPAYAHVHGVADGVANDGVRPVHAPAEPVALRCRENLVFLRVIEILYVEPRLVLADRRRRQSALAFTWRVRKFC